MKSMKKFLALALVFVMLTGLAITASAASIEITHDASYTNVDDDNSEARVYLAYKIFDANYDTLAGENTQDDKDDFSYDPDDAAVSYSMASDNPWVPVMKLEGQTWFDVKETTGGYAITPKEGKYTSASDAKDFADFLVENMPDGAPSTNVTVDAAAVTVAPGYYLIVASDSKDGSANVAIVTTDVTMVEKNTYIDTGKTTDQQAYNVGDEVPYTATVTIPTDTALTIEDASTDSGYKAGHGPIILHDALDPRLDFEGTITTTLDASAYELDDEPDDDCTFHIILPVTADLLGETVTFEFKGVVTERAQDPDTGLINTWFGEINGYKTVPDEPFVYTFDFNLIKVFDDEDDDELTATFNVYNEEGDLLYFTSGDEENQYVLASENIQGAIKDIVLTNGVQVNFTGLADGDYTLKEIATSTGYNLLSGDVTITITDETPADATIDDIAHSVTVGEMDDVSQDGSTAVITIENHSGTVLPSTGGIGTTLFYVFGTILVLAAGVVLVTKRRVRE